MVVTLRLLHPVLVLSFPNEGNGRMASSIPKSQVIFLGTERIVPDFKALDVMMEC